MTTIITEFPINLDDECEGLGALIITDAQLLVRPRKVQGYPMSVKHDTSHAYGILRLGNDMGVYTTHIICKDGPSAAHQLLDRLFYAYVDGCCLELWCDARVCYIDNGEVAKVEEYGFDDGSYTMFFRVYCNVTDTEAFLATLIANETDRTVVVRPDPSDELGYNVRGFVAT